VPRQVKPFRLAKRNIKSEEHQRAEVQQERPSGVHSRRIPVVQHAKKLKDDIVFQYPFQQWRTHDNDARSRQTSRKKIGCACWLELLLLQAWTTATEFSSMAQREVPADFLET
jgi:hypothetical protein